jgi:RNA polymerase sigma-70 factor (ECF subfamily)
VRNSITERPSLQEETIQDIIRRSTGRDLIAFEHLVKHFQSYAFALAVRLLCNESEANDAVQEAFVRVWKHIDRYDEKQKFTTWLYRIVTNLCLDHLRAVKRSRALFSSVEDEYENPTLLDNTNMESLSSNRDLADVIKRLTLCLSARQKLVFTLRDLQDLSVEEVTEITGMSVSSVKTNLHYARKRIRELLAKQYNVRSLEV